MPSKILRIAGGLQRFAARLGWQATRVPEFGRSVEDELGGLDRQAMNTEEVALRATEEQLRNRGYSVVRTTRNSPQGDLHATKGAKVVRIEVKGLAKRSAVWLRPRQVAAVDVVVVYIAAEKHVWVLTAAEARSLVDHYHADFVMRRGRPPKGPGWNQSQFPPPTGWSPLDRVS